ncbi:MAG: hypothetical protein QXL18_05160 [Candidatus Woesearchaeota archaeon]
MKVERVSSIFGRHNILTERHLISKAFENTQYGALFVNPKLTHIAGSHLVPIERIPIEKRKYFAKYHFIKAKQLLEELGV